MTETAGLVLVIACCAMGLAAVIALIGLVVDELLDGRKRRRRRKRTD